MKDLTIKIPGKYVKKLFALIDQTEKILDERDKAREEAKRLYPRFFQQS